MSGPALLLWPGASATRNQSALVAIDEAVTALGVTVRRLDFANPRARQPVLVAAVASEASGPSGLNADSLWLGGRSMGGRMCSLAVAEGLPARGLVLVSYPLHPPGRPDRMRTEHFPAIKVPCLFVSGTRDTFGSPAELEEATAAISGQVTHHWIEGGDHGLRGADKEVAATVAEWIKAALKPLRRRRASPGR
jgi:uncharacterized protein